MPQYLQFLFDIRRLGLVVIGLLLNLMVAIAKGHPATLLYLPDYGKAIINFAVNNEPGRAVNYYPTPFLALSPRCGYRRCFDGEVITVHKRLLA